MSRSRSAPVATLGFTSGPPHACSETARRSRCPACPCRSATGQRPVAEAKGSPSVGSPRDRLQPWIGVGVDGSVRPNRAGDVAKLGLVDVLAFELIVDRLIQDLDVGLGRDIVDPR